MATWPVSALLMAALSVPPIQAAVQEIPAAAEVTASSGPLRMTLRLHETRLRIGERLWFQLDFTNTGRTELSISDDILKDFRHINDNIQMHRGIYFEALDPDGKPLVYTPYIGAPHYCMRARRVRDTLDDIDDPILAAKVRKWKQSKMSIQEMERRVVDYLKKEDEQFEEMEYSSAALKPGGSVKSTPWAHPMVRNCKTIPRRPIGQYTELWSYEFEVPGTYRVRAVYDKALSEDMRKQYGLKPTDSDVRVESPWIAVQVE